MQRLLVSLALCAALAGVAGCDPTGPGASGVISLGAGIDASGFETLEMYAFANESQAAFDPSQPISGELEHRRETLAAIDFPFAYQVGGSVGITTVPTWTFVAWLSHTPASEPSNATVAPGDVFCAVPFRIRSCSGGSDFCAVTPDVACELAQIAPAR